jgi:hypothetical protein
MTVSPPDQQGERILRRAFGWGVLFIGDATADIVEVDPEVRVTWGSGREAVAVLVRHAQDTDDDVLDGLGDDDEVPDAEVSVVVRWGAEAGRETDADGFIAVPSGVLAVGDADAEESVQLVPGAWRLQLAFDRPQDADRVDVWLSPAPADSPV